MEENKVQDLSMKNVLASFNKASKLNEQHLYDFSHTLLSAKSLLLDENSILYFKKIFAIVSNHPEMLLHTSYLLRKVDIKIQNISLIGNIISIPINEILIQLSFANPLNFTKDGSGESEYLKSVTFICTKFPNLKKTIMEATFSLFCQFISNLQNGDQINIKNEINFFFIDFISNILSSLFQLEINLLWHSTENQNLVTKSIKSDHFFQLFNLIQLIPNTLVQMLISEWMWRAKNCLPSSFDFKTSLQKFRSFFLQINELNFRSSLHSFIRNINFANKDKNIIPKIIHFKFRTIIFNEIDLISKGYLDLNKDAIAIWFFEKGGRKIPDVIVFKFTQIYNIAIIESKISFLSKEKLIAFEIFSTSKPMKFEIHCYDAINKDQALLFSQRSLLKKVSQRKPIIIKSKHKETSEEYENLSKKRIYANNPQEIQDLDSIDSHDEIINNENDPEDQDKNNEEIINNNDNDDNFDKDEKNYKLKIMSFEDIERSLDNLQSLCKKMIDDVEKKAMSELNEIISFAETNIKELRNLSQKHEDAVDDTKLTESMLEEETRKFEIESEKSFDKIENEKKNYFDTFVDEISHEKSEFINETNRIFTSNALTALSNNLLDIKTCSIKNFNDE